MFEIYREPAAAGRYRVVYFTELDEHNQEKEINDAMRGEHVFDGYLRNHNKEEAKRIVTEILERLNARRKAQPLRYRARTEAVHGLSARALWHGADKGTPDILRTLPRLA